MKKAILISLIIVFTISGILFTRNQNSNISNLKLNVLKSAMASSGENDGINYDYGDGDNDGMLKRIVEFKVTCEPVVWTKTEYRNRSGEIVGNFVTVNGKVTATYRGSYHSSTTEAGTTGKRELIGWQCCSGGNDFCKPCNNPCMTNC